MYVFTKLGGCTSTACRPLVMIASRLTIALLAILSVLAASAGEERFALDASGAAASRARGLDLRAGCSVCKQARPSKSRPKLRSKPAQRQPSAGLRCMSEDIAQLTWRHSLGGRVLEAARDFECGEIIFEEQPLAIDARVSRAEEKEEPADLDNEAAEEYLATEFAPANQVMRTFLQMTAEQKQQLLNMHHEDDCDESASLVDSLVSYSRYPRRQNVPYIMLYSILHMLTVCTPYASFQNMHRVEYSMTCRKF